MEKELIGISVIFSEWSVIFPILLSVVTFHKNPRYLKVLGILVLVSGTCDAVGQSIYSLIPYTSNIYVTLEFLLFGFFYRFLLKGHTYRRIFLIAIILYFAGSFWTLVIMQNVELFKPSIRVFSTVYFIPLSIYLFYRILIDQPVDNILKYPAFWANTAILIFFSGNFFFYVAYLFFPDEKIYFLHFVIHMLNGLRNLLFGTALIFQYLNTRKATRYTAI